MIINVIRITGKSGDIVISDYLIIYNIITFITSLIVWDYVITVLNQNIDYILTQPNRVCAC